MLLAARNAQLPLLTVKSHSHTFVRGTGFLMLEQAQCYKLSAKLSTMSRKLKEEKGVRIILRILNLGTTLRLICPQMPSGYRGDEKNLRNYRDSRPDRPVLC